MKHWKIALTCIAQKTLAIVVKVLMTDSYQYITWDLPEVGGPMKMVYKLSGKIVPNVSILLPVPTRKAVVVIMLEHIYPILLLRDLAMSLRKLHMTSSNRLPNGSGWSIKRLCKLHQAFFGCLLILRTNSLAIMNRVNVSCWSEERSCLQGKTL